MQKRGLSEVVTAVLLVVIAIAAVLVVWGLVSGFFKAGASGATSCASIQLSITSATSPTGGNVAVTIKRDPNLAGDVKLNKIKIVVTKADGTTSIESPAATDLASELSSHLYQTTISSTNAKSVTVYPVIDSAGADKLCDKPVSKAIVSSGGGTCIPVCDEKQCGESDGCPGGTCVGTCTSGICDVNTKTCVGFCGPRCEDSTFDATGCTASSERNFCTVSCIGGKFIDKCETFTEADTCDDPQFGGDPLCEWTTSCVVNTALGLPESCSQIDNGELCDRGIGTDVCTGFLCSGDSHCEGWSDESACEDPGQNGGYTCTWIHGA